MQTNIEKIESIYISNSGYISREDIKQKNIPSSFLYIYAKRNNLRKIGPGIYSNKDYTVDNYYLFQKRYKKYIFSGLTALYLNGLTDKVPTHLEVSAPQGYHPTREKNNFLEIRLFSDQNIYRLGIKKIQTIYGHNVNVYDPERSICDLIKNRDKYDSESFIKAIRLYNEKYCNQIKLFEYAEKLGIRKKVFEIMEIFLNED